MTSVEGSDLQKCFSGLHQIKTVVPTKNAQDLRIMANNISLDKIREDKIVEVFVDRDQKLFETLIQFLRNEREHYPEFESVK